MDTDDVRVIQRGCEIGFAVESAAELVVSRHFCGQDLQRVAPRESWMLGEVDLAHTPGTQQARDRKTGEELAARQRHGQIVARRRWCTDIAAVRRDSATDQAGVCIKRGIPAVLHRPYR